MFIFIFLIFKKFIKMKNQEDFCIFVSQNKKIMTNEVLVYDLLEVNTSEKYSDYLRLQSDYLFYELLEEINKSEKSIDNEVR